MLTLIGRRYIIVCDDSGRVHVIRTTREGRDRTAPELVDYARGWIEADELMAARDTRTARRWG